jgi:hypothetical protein
MNIYKITLRTPAVVAMALSAATTLTAATLTVGNATSLPCTGTFPTIQSAVIAASSGDTISVCPGTYNEQVQITKTLTLLGAKNGVDARTRSTANESIIDNACGPVQIFADNVILDGFTIQGSTMPDPCFIAGIWMNPDGVIFHGGVKILNNIVQNNISGIELDSTCAANPTVVKFNLIQNNNNTGPGNGTGLQDNFVLCNATIDSNKFVHNLNTGILLFGPPVTSAGSNITVSNNEFDANGGAIALLGVTSSAISTNNIHNSGSGADIDIFGGVNGLSVSCNRLASGAGRAIQVEDPFGVGPNANVTINFNNISGYPVAGLEVDTAGYTGGPGSLDATNDWWGSATGPTIASNPGGTGEPIIDPDGVVTYKPFLTNPSTCAPPPPPTPTSFVIGDRSAVVGKKVTFWGAQWAKSNSLSGGSAPSSFKGYANMPGTNPPACGGTWKSNPGNSSGPPDSVPSLITVIVSSKVTQSGSMISGNIPEIVTVKTDPGYGPSPGHAGTGTVVAVNCP